MGLIQKFTNSVGKAWDHVQNLGDRFKSIIGSVQGYVGTAFEVAKNGSTFVGIGSTEQVNKIREAIRQYVRDVQTEVDKLRTDIKSTNALKGEAAEAADQYVEAVSKVAHAYVSALLAYSDKMYEYAEAYHKNDNQLASDVKDQASALSSSAEVYTEKY